MIRSSGTRSKVRVGENKGARKGRKGVWYGVCACIVWVGSDRFYGETEMNRLVWIEIEM